MPSRSQHFRRFSTSPGPPPQVSTASPPQNRKRPSILNAWRPVGGLEADPLAPHPDHGVEAVLDEDLDQIRMAAEAGDACHVVVVLLARVPPEVGVLDLRGGEIHEPGEILDPFERDPHRARGVAAVSPAFGFGGRFEHQHLRALPPRRQRGAHRRVAGPHHDHVGLAVRHHGSPRHLTAGSGRRTVPRNGLRTPSAEKRGMLLSAWGKLHRRVS